MIIMIIIIDTESEKLINKATNIYIYFTIWEADTHMKSHAYLFIFFRTHPHTDQGSVSLDLALISVKYQLTWIHRNKNKDIFVVSERFTVNIQHLVLFCCVCLTSYKTKVAFSLFAQSRQCSS